MDKRLLAVAVQGSLAGVEDRGDRNGGTHESRPGAEKALWHLYPSVAKRHGAFPGQRFPRVLAESRRKKRQYRQCLRPTGVDPLCCHGSFCAVEVLGAFL